MDVFSTIRSHLDDIFNFNDGGKIIVLVSAVLVSIYYFLYRKGNHKYPPGPMGLPFLGYWPFLGSEPHKTLRNLSKKYGNIFGLYLGQNYAVACNDWDAVRDALSKSETLNRPLAIFDILPYGIGFGSENGHEWVEQRRFSVRAMKEIGLGKPQWEALLQEEVNEIIQEINSKVGQTLDVGELFNSTFTNNIMTMLLGHRLPYGDPTVKLVSEDIDSVTQQFPSLGLGNFLPKLSAFLTNIGFYGSTETIRKLKEFSALIEKYVEKRLKNHEMDDEESFVKTYYREVQNNKKNNLNNSFTDYSLYGNTQTLILGGSETTKNAFMWLLISMAQFPEKQSKVYQEINRVLGKDGTIKWSDRTNVPYTFATIMESLRWMSLVPINTLRMTSEDSTILGFHVPKGTIIVSNVWALHNDPKYWPDPRKFEPERFLLDGGKQINFRPDSYIPFSFGKRNCPGEMIASMSILQYFTAIMQKFKVLPEKGSVVKFDTKLGLTYQPQNVKLRFVPRE